MLVQEYLMDADQLLTKCCMCNALYWHSERIIGRELLD